MFMVNQMVDYVIDENVIENAVHGKKPQKNGQSIALPADAENEFLYRFFRNKDRMFVNDKIRQKIYSLEKRIRIKHKSEFLDNRIIPRLLETLQNFEKTITIDGIQTEFSGIKNCDKEFVGVTLQSNATLVTADGDLKILMIKDKLVSKCKCFTVEEVLDSS